MTKSFEQLVAEIVGDEPSVETIVEALSRRGFLASPMTSGFTDRQVRIHLIQLLGRMGDPAALEVLRAHARLPAGMGQELVAEAARAAIARIEDGAGGARASAPAVDDLQQQMARDAEEALAAFLTPPSDPAVLEAAGLRGSALTRRLLELDVEAPPAPEGDGEDPAAGAERVLEVLRGTGCEDDILAQVGERLEAPEDAERWFDVTILLRQHGHFHGALEAYDHAVAYFDPEISSMLWSNRGILLQSWERYKEAIASFRRALEIRPGYQKARAAMGDAFRRLHDFEAAAAVYQAVVDAEPGNAVVWELLGITREQQCQIAEAIRCFESCLEHDPGNAEALLDLARVHCREGSFAEARRWHERLMAVAPAAPGAAGLLETIDGETSYSPRFEDAFAPRRLLRQLKPEARAPGQGRIRPYTLLASVDLAIEDPAEEGDVLDALVQAEIARRPRPGAKAAPRGERIFISYRWESDEHRKWVWKFANDLKARQYRVHYDQFEDLETREQIGAPILRVDRMAREVPELVSQLARTDVFLPILSEGYRRCVEHGRTGELAGRTTELSRMARVNPDDGWVFDEWQLALRLRLAGRLRWQAVWRSGSVVPPPFVRGSVCDFRGDGAYAKKLAAHFPRPGG